MDSRNLIMVLLLLTLTIVALGTWRASAASQHCARQGGTYSMLQLRCIGPKAASRIILQRDLMRS